MSTPPGSVPPPPSSDPGDQHGRPENAPEPGAPTPYGSPPGTGPQPLADYGQTGSQPVAGYGQTATGNEYPPGGPGHPSPADRPPSAGSAPPAPGYGQPVQGYGQPPPGYGQSPPAPGQPVWGYGQPEGYGQPGGYGQQSPHQPAASSGYPSSPPPPDPAPPRKRPRWVPIVAAIAIIAVVVAGLAGALTFLAAERDRREAEELRAQQAAEADEAAAEFFTALDAHEEVWSEERVGATFGPGVAEEFAWISLDYNDLADPAESITQACTEQSERVAAFAELEGSTRPSLEEVPGTSDDYRRAQAAARVSSGLAAAEAKYLDEGRGLSEDLLVYCQAWSDGVQTLAAEQAEYDEVINAVLIPHGESQSEGNWTADCNSLDGCLPLRRADREQYADATVQYYTVLHQTKDQLFSAHCLDGYEAYCEAEIALAEVEVEWAETAMDLLRGSLGSGDEALPGYNDAVEDWAEEIDAGREENAELLAEAGSEVVSIPAGHFGNHQREVLGSWESDIAEMASATLHRNRADQA